MKKSFIFKIVFLVLALTLVGVFPESLEAQFSPSPEDIRILPPGSEVEPPTTVEDVERINNTRVTPSDPFYTGVRMGTPEEFRNANASGPLTTVSALLARIENILNIIIPFLVGLAVFLIIYGLLRYVLYAADEEKRKEGKDFILWGIFGVFLMLSVWGLVNILVNSLPTDNSRAAVTRVYPTGQVPNLPTTDPNLIDLIQRVQAIGPYIIGFFFTIAFFIILIGILNYIKEGANEEKRAEARKFIIWGIVSLFVMLSIWGLTNVLVNSIQLDNQLPASKIPKLPEIPVPSPPR